MRFLSTGVPIGRAKSALDDVFTPLAFLLGSFLFTVIFFTTRNGAPNDTNNGFSCRVDTPSFPWQGEWNRIWDSRLFLSITLAFGRFTFSQAKAIDICWDLIIGRGGQMFAGYAAYQVMRKSLYRAMEDGSLHIPVTASLIFEGLSISAFSKIVRDIYATIRQRGSWNGRLLCYLFMIAYLLSFGTIVSAMTGYQAQMTPFFSDWENPDSQIASSTIPQNSTFPGAVIRDGTRIGLSPFATLTNTSEGFPTFRKYQQSFDHLSTFDQDDCKNVTQSMIKESSYELSFSWLNNKCNYTNSSIQYAGDFYALGPDPLHISLDDVYNVSGIVMNKTWLEQTSACQPGRTYQWGFSSQLLFLFCVCTTVYALILASLQWDIWCYGQTSWFKQRHGLYRDILDMAREIKEELDIKDDQHMTADTLDAMLTTARGAICVSDEGLPPARRDLGLSLFDPMDTIVDGIPKRARAKLRQADDRFGSLMFLGPHSAAVYGRSRPDSSPETRDSSVMTRTSRTEDTAALIPGPTSRVSQGSN